LFLSVFVVRRELLYVSTSFRICQELFSSFIKFFCAVLRSGRFRRSSHNSIKIPHIISFVKNFFQVFTNFFVFSLVLRRPPGQLGYNTTGTFICQALFSNIFQI